jgi:hypothetical protein
MMYKKHCFLVFLIAFLLGANHVLAQSNCSYVVISTGGYSLSQIDQAFSAARLDAYRKKTVRREMHFTNGAEVHLLSASELQSQNCPVNGTLAMEDNQPLDPGRLFEIHPSGVIIASVQAEYKR